MSCPAVAVPEVGCSYSFSIFDLLLVGHRNLVSRPNYGSSTVFIYQVYKILELLATLACFCLFITYILLHVLTMSFKEYLVYLGDLKWATFLLVVLMSFQHSGCR